MSRSLLYHGSGIVEYRYIRIEYREGEAIFTITTKKFSLRCSGMQEQKGAKARGFAPREEGHLYQDRETSAGM